MDLTGTLVGLRPNELDSELSAPLFWCAITRRFRARGNSRLPRPIVTGEFNVQCELAWHSRKEIGVRIFKLSCPLILSLGFAASVFAAEPKDKGEAEARVVF